MASSSRGTVVALMTKALGSVFKAETWAMWRVLLKAAFALDLSDAERAALLPLIHRTVLANVTAGL